MTELVYDRYWAEHSVFGRSLAWVMNNQTVCPRVPIAGCQLKGTPIPPANPALLLKPLILQRAQEFLNVPLGLMWSGGVDSTLVAALLASPKLTVICQESTEANSPAFVSWLSSKGATISHYQPEAFQYLAERMPILTGTHGDSILLGELVDIGDFYEDVWTCSLAELVAWNRDSSVELAQFHLNNIKPLLDACPISSPTTADLAWWLDFSTLWDRDLWWFTVQAQLPKGRIINFFDTPAFQAWAQRPVIDKVGETKADHKWIYLSMIEELCPEIPAPVKGNNPLLSKGIPNFDIVAVDSLYRPYFNYEDVLCVLYS